VQLLFERGHFLPADTAATAAAVRLYAVGLTGYSVVRIASPTFYAIGESRIPAIVSTGVIAVNVAASVALVRVIGFQGLALGTSIAAIVNAAVLLWMLRRRLGGIEGGRLLTTLVKVTLSAVLMAVAAFLIQFAMDRLIPGVRLTAQTFRLAASIGGALATLAATAKILGVDELADAVETIHGWVRKLLSD
jgi:putative peptidoglycan lipid II flippase